MNHQFISCQLRSTGQCSGCRDGESQFDCVYESLAVCGVCGGCEGSLLPLCPGYQLTHEQHEENYVNLMKVGTFTEARVH